MTAKLIKGAEVAAQIREELKKEVEELKSKHNVTPGLVTILVGEDPASVSYVTAKQKTSHELGFYSIQDNQPPDITEEQLLALIDKYNKDPKIHGILVQLPLPKHIDSNKVLYAIDPDKDVDAFHPVNVGRLCIGTGIFLPCTPAGCKELINRGYGDPKGKELVVVGRSNIVGKPMVNIMLQKAPGANATVTVVHTGTPPEKIIEHCRRADILVVAAGVPKYVKGDWVKEGACVIDVGVNRIGVTESGKAKLCGDVDFDEVKEKASCITPVPGGVGPMTITMLMSNTVMAAKHAAGIV
ncbi:MAG: bifunctional 5,10-methylene-tetrahydrofolate dehydrogenase/5,10-methylene-tetrahydrofolate cyclohydrolase [Deltaproteobacteria bacterium]|nr:bifunctional 5,10-methylene-tetrahydrofolate dehydrogenase/5,10-methylene-tetrahydrofolate cyclohydrolase [Deltaproteobacteria bacterium]MBW1951566.1 bifunctional 5,10-methylene-tetrahydrofolate dehydrogenase/5,10-methylene-tetrahydrofolate cyclohydrolase [Deltaproteobacteria bacterium]MBW1986813.1 bifunctional 5,10-methylene-tetrahydrofolate dehydrogenase/5,10-methylene-tetrahydrofolate cyclohydrolase [Deltaproteobacteria bacterium]MBW2135233.1 bifunctional 5,10-methylene-tetrahydrofolate de